MEDHEKQAIQDVIDAFFDRECENYEAFPEDRDGHPFEALVKLNNLLHGLDKKPMDYIED
jgi:hypothetical protein